MFKIYSTGGSPLEIKISLTMFGASSLSLGENGFAYLFFHGLFLSWILCPNPKESKGLSFCKFFGKIRMTSSACSSTG
jgi:hypothetical protein